MKQRMQIAVAGGALMVLLGMCPATARAQLATDPYFNIAIARATPARARTRRSPEEQRAAQAQMARGREVIRSGRASTSFQPASALLVPSRIAQSRTNDPEQRRQLEQTFVGYIKWYEDEMRRERYAINDVAVAVSALFDVSRQIHSAAAPLTPPQTDSLLQYVRNDLLKNESFQGASNREKQLMYESLVIGISNLSALHNNAQRTNDAQARRKAQAEAGDTIRRLMGITPDRIRVTQASVIFP